MSNQFPVFEGEVEEFEEGNPGAFPFYFQKFNSHIVLPKPLGGKRARGVAVLEVYINSKGEIKLVNVVKLVVRKGKHVSIDYFEKEPSIMRRKTYPSIVRPYVPLLSRHIKSQALAKSSRVEPQEINQINVLVFFGKPSKRVK